MISRKTLLVTVVLTLFVVALAGCVAAQPMSAPDVELSMDAAMAGQQKAMEGLMTGSATMSDAEFSSLATALIQQNLPGVPVESVVASFDDGNSIMLMAQLPGGMAANLSGKVMVEDNIIQLDLEEASAMGMAAADSILGVVEGAINRALNDPSLGVAVDVSTAPGEITIGLGQ